MFAELTVTVACLFMEDIKNRFTSILEYSEVLAAAILKKMDPLKDEISQSEAYRLFGAGFVKEGRRLFNFTVKHIGNKTVYSRHELIAARESLKETDMGAVNRGI